MLEQGFWIFSPLSTVFVRVLWVDAVQVFAADAFERVMLRVVPEKGIADVKLPNCQASGCSGVVEHTANMGLM
jgi:hypothetical protein